VENKGNEYIVADPSRMMIIMSNELNEAKKRFSKRSSRKEIQEKIKENTQNQLKKHQDNTNKNLEKTQKQLNEL
jgi:hypothetical protein